MANKLIEWENQATSATHICVFIDKVGEPSSAEPMDILLPDETQYQVIEDWYDPGEYLVSIVPTIMLEDRTILFRDRNPFETTIELNGGAV